MPKVTHPESGQTEIETQVGLAVSLCSLNRSLTGSSWDEGLNQMALKGPSDAPIKGTNHENTVRGKNNTKHDPNVNSLLLYVIFPLIQGSPL